MGINRYLGENYGSLIKIEYAPAARITGFAPVGNKITAAAILFATGYAWQSIYCSVDTMGHKQTITNDANGSSWSQQVVGFVPGDEDEIETGLIALPDMRYILRITRPNGMIRIVGSPQQPLDLILDSNSQNNVPGAAGTAITFNGITSQRALIMTT